MRGADASRRLVEHVRTPLHRDAYALGVNSTFTAATGLVYWIIAAKSYSAHAVGVNAALISVMMFLAGLGSLNLPNLLVRFLPEAGSRTARVALGSYAVAVLVAAATAVVFVLGIGAWAPRLGFLRSDHWLQGWFLLSTLAWCVFVIQDSVLTALGRAVWVPIENAVFSVVKIALLAALAASVPRYGIFVSWTIAMLLSVVGVNLVIFARLTGPASKRAAGTLLTLRDRALARYMAADFAGATAWLAAVNIPPVIVTAVAGATTNAYYALAWAAAFPLYLFASNVGTSLVLHGTTDPAALPTLTRKAAVQGARILVPAAAILVVVAPYVLSLFGAAYRHHGTTLLRLFALAALPNLVIALSVSHARVTRRMRVAVIALASQAAMLLALMAPLIHALGLDGAGVAWIASECAVAGALVAARRAGRGRERLAPTPCPIRVLDVELDEPLPDVGPVARERPYHRAHVLVRRHGRPLGLVDVPFEGDGVPALALSDLIAAQLGDRLGADDEGAPAPAAPPPPGSAFSVVVATRDRPHLLRGCLESILAGDSTPGEIVVVDNAPHRPGTAALVRDAYAHEPTVRYTVAEEPGLTEARSTGLALAGGEFVVFTDDDVVVDRRWLAAIAEAFAGADRVTAVTTLILPRELETPAQLWLEEFGGFAKGFRRQIFDLGEHRSPDRLYPYSAGIYGSGASMAFRARELRELGGFDRRLSFGAEDLDLFLKVILAGQQLVYEPAAIVWHLHPSEYRSLRRTMFWYGAGLTALMTKWSLSDPAIARDIAARLPAALRLVLSPNSRKNERKRPGYPRVLTLVERVGMIAGPFVFARSSWKARRAGGR